MRFLNTILITALTYNPARILGLVGFGLVVAGFLSSMWRTVTRSPARREDSQLVSWYAGLVLASAGVNIFSLGTVFNYIVSLFHKRPIRQGLFGKPIFKKPLERQFGWLGLAAILGGVIMYGLDVGRRWDRTKHHQPVVAAWFVPASSSILVLTGLQLMASWLLTLVLGELTKRETKAQADLGNFSPNGRH
jgi:hypothetical protein